MRVSGVKPGRSVGDRFAPTSGFSIIEPLIAAAVLLIIALGLIPLFARAMVDNNIGNDATQASNHGRTRLEELIQLPFNHQSLTLANGAPETQAGESWTLGFADQIGDADEGWWPGAPADKGLTLWSRTTRVRQFNINDLDDGRLDNPQAGGTQPIFVHLKEVEVQLDNAKQGSILGGGRPFTVRVLKAF